MKRSMRYHLQVEVHTSNGSKWRDVEAANSKADLESLIPEGREDDFRILNKTAYSAFLNENKNPENRKKRERFSKNLLNILREKKMTRAEAARACGFSRSTAWSFYNAVNFPREENIQKMCEGLGVSRAELLGERE